MQIESRRSFLHGAIGLLTIATLPTPAIAATQAEAVRTRIGRGTTERRLFIQNRRTDEIFDGIYADGKYLLGGSMMEINHLMRDKTTGEVIRIDPRLIELLGAVQRITGFDEPIQMISGYRCRKSNAKIRSAAKNSYHIKGMAADLRIKGVPTKDLREIGERFGIGGVGYYPKREFVHLDTGPVRVWRG